VPPAIVLAGGGEDPRLAPGLPNKAFLELGGRPLVVRVLDALRACPEVDRIVVVGPAAALGALVGSAADVIPERDALMRNIDAATAHLGATGPVLIVASDLPLLSGDAVSAFLARCAPGGDFYYPIVPQAALEQRFPGARKTFVTVTDGTFCGGSVLLFDARVIDQVRPLIEQIIAARKKPWVLAQLFGWATVLKFASGRLSIAEMETRAYEVAKIRGRAVIVDLPELALDVDADRPENLAILRDALARAG
jgi:GTP:adenosylcobinamide-phosphate guanylyltransferase